MEQAKKRDHKIVITDIAILKVPLIIVPGLPMKICRALQEEHKNLLRISQRENDSNEVLTVGFMDFSRMARVKGTENYVDPSMSPEAYGIFNASGRKGLFYLHNHPSTNTFSLADLAEFIRYARIGLMSVVTNQGQAYIISKSAHYEYKRARELFTDIYGRYTKGEYAHDDAVRRFLGICERGGIDYAKGSQDARHKRRGNEGGA